MKLNQLLFYDNYILVVLGSILLLVHYCYLKELYSCYVQLSYFYDAIVVFIENLFVVEYG
mgnify:CR=1 FL=1